MKRKISLKTLLVFGLAAIALTSCVKTNNKPTTTIIEETTLSANKYYESNNFILRADENNNKLENILIYSSTYNLGVYIRPLIENNKFKSVFVINTNISKYGDDLKYIDKTTGYSPILDLAITGIDNIYVTKPLSIKLEDNKINLLFNNKTCVINLDGSIDKEFDNFNLKLSSKFNDDILNDNEKEITLNKDLFHYKKDETEYKLEINNNTINRYIDDKDDNILGASDVTFTLNDDLTIKSSTSSYGVSQYTYSDDKKTIKVKRIVNDEQSFSYKSNQDELPNIPSITLLNISTCTFDDNYRLINTKSAMGLDENTLFDEYETSISYNDDNNYNEIIDSNHFSKTKLLYQYDEKGYITSSDYYSLNDTNQELISQELYEYDSTYNLSNYNKKKNNIIIESATQTVNKYNYHISHFYYDNNGSLITADSKRYDETYDKKGRLVEHIEYKKNNFDMQDYKLNYNYLTEDGYNIIEITQMNYNSYYFVNHHKTIYKTKENDNITEYYEYNSSLDKFILSSSLEEIIIDSLTKKIETKYELPKGEEFPIKSECIINETKDNYKTTSTIYYDEKGYENSGEKNEIYLDNNGYTLCENDYIYDKNINEFLLDESKVFFNNSNLVRERITYTYYNSYLTGHDSPRNIKEYIKEEYILNDNKTSTLINKSTYICYLEPSINIGYQVENIKNLYKYTYDDNYNNTSIDLEKYEDGSLKYHQITNYSYTNNNLTGSLEIRYDINSKVIYVEEKLKINDKYKVVNKKDLINGELKDLCKSDFNYNNTFKKYEEFTYSNETHLLTDYYITNYDDNGNFLDKTSYQYDENNKIINKKEYILINGEEKVLNEYKVFDDFDYYSDILLYKIREYDENGILIGYKTHNYYNKQCSYYEYICNNGSERGLEIYNELIYLDQNLNPTYIYVFSHLDSRKILNITAHYEIRNGERILTRQYFYNDNHQTIRWVYSYMNKNKDYFDYIVDVTYEDEVATSVVRYQNDIENNTYTKYYLDEEYLTNSSVWYLDEYTYYYSTSDEPQTGNLSVSDVCNMN